MSFFDKRPFGQNPDNISVEERVGFSQCTGMLSGDAHLNTQARGLSLTWRNVNTKDTTMQEG